MTDETGTVVADEPYCKTDYWKTDTRFYVGLDAEAMGAAIALAHFELSESTTKRYQEGTEEMLATLRTTNEAELRELWAELTPPLRAFRQRMRAPRF